MGDLSPETVAFWVSNELEDETFSPLQEAVAALLVRRGTSLSEEEAADFAEKYMEDIVSHLRAIEARLISDGNEPLFRIDTSDPKYYVKASRKDVADYVMRLIALDDKQFERFCTRVLVALKATSAETCGGKADGCVDFIGKHLELSSPSSIGAKVLVVGQAKKYSRHNLVKLNEVRTFVGGAIQRVANHLDLLTFRSGLLAPVVYAFWTTSEFHPSARRYATDVGLWHLNGNAVAQLAMRVGITDPESS
jgi:restriction endonuclease Mrr